VDKVNTRSRKVPKARRAVGRGAEEQALRNLTHELRTALGAIIGFSETMRSELYGPINNDHYKDYADGIFHSGKHLLDLLNAYTDFSALQDGNLELQEEPVDLDLLVGQVLRVFRPGAKKSDVNISSNPLGALPSLFVDKARFKQILSSLLFHAIHRAPNGGDVGIRVNERDGGMVIKIRHSGAAMTDEEISEALKESISSAPNWLYRKEASAGLGLLMASKLTEALGGAFSISGKPGKGTMVRLFFPQECLVA